MVSYSMSYCNCPQANLRAPKNENTKSTLCIYMEKSSLTPVTPSIFFSGDRFEASSLASVSEWSLFGWAGGAVEDILPGSEWEPEDTNLKVATQLSTPDFIVYFNSKWDHKWKNYLHVILWLRPWTHQETISWIKWVVGSSSHKIAYNPLFWDRWRRPLLAIRKKCMFNTLFRHGGSIHTLCIIKGKEKCQILGCLVSKLAERVDCLVCLA